MLKTDYLRAQDVLAACKLLSLGRARREWTYSALASDLGLSAGEAHNAVDRCRRGGLLLPSREISAPVLRDLLIVAVPRIFYAQRGEIAAGVVTGTSAPPLRGRFKISKHALPLVWPSEDGVGRRGESVAPVYPTAALAARDELVYELLALVDVLRVGGVSDRDRATEIMDELLLGRKARRDEEEGA